MLYRIKAYMEQYQMLREGDLVLVGVSGGADSVCMLQVLVKLREELQLEKGVSFQLEAVHVEHGIRGEESLADADFTRKLCDKLGVSFTLIQVDVLDYAKRKGLGHEEAARILRYEAFVEQAKKRSESGTVKVALAHHMEDNAETMLFQMIRGSGLKGMCGIAPLRMDQAGVTYIRPLLCVQRWEIENYLKELEQTYCIDSTNLELEYSRNKLRHQVMPLLQEINTQAVMHMNQSAFQLKSVWEYMQQQVQEQMERVWLADCPCTIDAAWLCQVHPALQAMLAHEILAKVAGQRKDLTAVHVGDLLELAKGESGKQLHLPYGIRVRKEYDRLVFFNRGVKEKAFSSQAASQREIQISKEDLAELQQKEKMQISLGAEEGYLELSCRKFEGKMEKIPKNQCTKWLDYDKIKNGFQLRRRKSGDYFVHDSHGHHKKLKQYFIDEKIPATLREQIWLLAVDSEVVWIVGGRMGETYKVSEDTREILQIEYVEGSAYGFYKRL